MATKNRNDRRLLSKDEQELVAQTRQPTIKGLSDLDLADLVKSLRKCHGQAQETSRFSQRKLPRQARTIGSAATPDNGASRPKLTLLVAAVKRANKEIQRRFVASARTELKRTQ